jgi:hypothetical protein
MRIPKLLPVVCAAAFCAGFITVRAEDNPTQAAARAALMEKLNQWDVQQPPPAQPAQPTQPSQPSQPATSPAVVVTPSGAVQEQPGQPTNAPSKTNVVAGKQSKKTAAPKTKPAAAETKPVVVQPSKPASPALSGKEPGLQPVKAPAPVIAADKKAKLQALLEKYEANQITPDQYHTERAKIMAAP